MASGFPAEIIKCRACGARDVELTSWARADAVVSCYQCGTVLWTWPEFLNRVGAIVDARKPAVVTMARPRVGNLRAY
jgi:uncharacterized Zn finger protein